MVGRRNYTFDANMLLSDGATAYVAPGWSMVSGTPVGLDLGGNQGISINLPSIAATSTIYPQAVNRFEGFIAIYSTSAIVTASNFYRIFAVGSNSINFASNNVVLGALELGYGAALDIPNAATSHGPSGAGNYPAGDIYELGFSNEQNGVVYQYLGLYVNGTFGSITFSAGVFPLPRI